MTDIRIHDRIVFFLGSTGVLSGIFLTNIFYKNIQFLLLFLIILSIQILFFYKTFWRYVSIFLFAFCMGVGLSFIRLHSIETTMNTFQKHTQYFWKETRIQGVLSKKNSENSKWVGYILREVSIDAHALPEKTGILVMFTDAHNKKLDDIVVFTGQLRLPTSNSTFDYQTYLLLDDVYATTTISSSTKIATKKSFWIVRFIRSVREKFLQTIEDIYPEQSAKLLSGLLIGERADLSTQTKTHFNNTGLTHIIAVSGFNITIILIFLSFLFRPFPSIIKLLLAFMSVGFFTFLVGPQISVLRASVFGILSYGILLSGRRMRSFALLVAIAIGFVVMDPLILNYDVSFHLSFLAVFWLLFFGNRFNAIFSFLPGWFGLRESLAMCFAAMVFTLPIIVVNFWLLSIIAPIANIVVVPLIPLIMLGGFLSMIIDLFSHTMAILVGFPTWLGLEYILRSVAFFSWLSYASVNIDLGVYRMLFMAGYFIVMGIVVLWYQEEEY